MESPLLYVSLVLLIPVEAYVDENSSTSKPRICSLDSLPLKSTRSSTTRVRLFNLPCTSVSDLTIGLYSIDKAKVQKSALENAEEVLSKSEHY